MSPDSSRRTCKPSAKVERHDGLQLCLAHSQVFRLAWDVGQNCGLAAVRFELKSETHGPRCSKTAVRLARNWIAGNFRPDVQRSREGGEMQTRVLRSLKAALWPVMNRLSVACRLS